MLSSLTKHSSAIVSSQNTVGDSVYVHVDKLRASLIVKQERDYYVTINGLKDDRIKLLNEEIQQFKNSNDKLRAKGKAASTGCIVLTVLLLIAICL